MVLIICSDRLMGTDASLMEFYCLHLLEVITITFLIPLVIMIGTGILTLFMALFGFVCCGQGETLPHDYLLTAALRTVSAVTHMHDHECTTAL